MIYILIAIVFISLVCMFMARNDAFFVIGLITFIVTLLTLTLLSQFQKQKVIELGGNVIIQMDANAFTKSETNGYTVYTSDSKKIAVIVRED